MPQFFQQQFNQQPNFSYYVQLNLFVEKKNKNKNKKTKKVKLKKLESHKEKSSPKQNNESKS